MSLRVKILVSVVLLMALAFALGGTMLISASFQSALAREKEMALHAYQMILYTLEAVNGEGAIRRRLFDMGITPGAEVYLRKKAPLGDPIEIALRGYELTLRKAEAAHVEIK